MATFTEMTCIDAPIHKVWARLADHGVISDWNPGLKSSHPTNNVHGLGASRHCIVDSRHSLDETIVHFEPDTALTFRMTKTTLPFLSADVRFRLTTVDGQTEVYASPMYLLKYGIAGQLLNGLWLAGSYRRTVRNLLSGLKDDVENACSFQIK
jgi:hypothetical protein